MQTIFIVLHLFLAAGLIGLILIQHGKGADMGAAFGSGASGTVFGAKGSASFLTRLTAGLATLFFITSMTMAYFATQRDDKMDILSGLQPQAVDVENQTQSDVPPAPAPADNDMPPVPVTAEETEAQTAAPMESAEQAAASSAPADNDMPPVPATVEGTEAQTAAPMESGDQPAVPSSSDEEKTQATEAPVAPAPAVDAKE